MEVNRRYPHYDQFSTDNFWELIRFRIGIFWSAGLKLRHSDELPGSVCRQVASESWLLHLKCSSVFRFSELTDFWRFLRISQVSKKKSGRLGNLAAAKETSALNPRLHPFWKTFLIKSFVFRKNVPHGGSKWMSVPSQGLFSSEKEYNIYQYILSKESI